MSIYLPEESDQEFDINILPMIDVIFAILTFFIISSLSMIRLETIPVNLPSASSSAVTKDKFINVNVDKFSKIYINKRLTNIRDLREVINSLINSYSNKLVVLSADRDVSYGLVVEVLDQLRSIDDLRVGISTQK